MKNSLWDASPFFWLTEAAEVGATFFAPASPQESVGAPHHESMQRQKEYCLYVPENALVDPPLVVMLHGAGQDPDDFAAGTAMNAVAQRHGFIVLYPAQPSQANAFRCWNWFEPAHQLRGQGEPARLAALTLEVARRYQVDRTRIYVAGLSAGGAMAALLGELYPEIYAAVGVHSGLAALAGSDISSALVAMRQGARRERPPSGIPTIVFHGDMDVTVSPINGTQVMEASLGADCSHDATEHTGLDGRRFTRRNYFNEALSVRGEQWTLHDAAHAWSGGSSEGSFTDPLGPRASEEMLRFFGDHRGPHPRQRGAPSVPR